MEDGGTRATGAGSSSVRFRLCGRIAFTLTGRVGAISIAGLVGATIGLAALAVVAIVPTMTSI